MDEIKKDWEKVTRISKTAGYREGVSDGRESKYQNHFDEGYQAGFRNGFRLGQAKGLLSISKTGDDKSNQHLRSTRLGCCQLCTDQNLFSLSKQEIVNIQNSHVDNVLSNFKFDD